MLDAFVARLEQVLEDEGVDQQQKQRVVLQDTFEDALRLADQLCEEVGALAMAAGTVDGTWKSREDSVRGLGDEKVELQVTGWWGDGYFTGTVAITMSSLDSQTH